MRRVVLLLCGGAAARGDDRLGAGPAAAAGRPPPPSPRAPSPAATPVPDGAPGTRTRRRPLPRLRRPRRPRWRPSRRRSRRWCWRRSHAAAAAADAVLSKALVLGRGRRRRGERGAHHGRVERLVGPRHARHHSWGTCMRFEPVRLALVAALLAAPALSACSSSSRSFIVLTLKTSGRDDPERQTGGREGDATRTARDERRSPIPATNVTIDGSGTNTLSVKLQRGRERQGRLRRRGARRAVPARPRHGAPGRSRPRGSRPSTSRWSPTAGCNTDGGVDGPPEGGVFPGCDPVSPTCGDGQTCQVNCATSRNECTPGGSGGAGQRLHQQRRLPARNAVLRLCGASAAR